MDKEIQVTEWMGDFIKWAYDLGEDKVRSLVREHLAEMKEHAEKTNNSHKKEEEPWDEVLEPNDGNDQWKHGGDCNLCRKIDYCKKKCRPNRLLKKITTPFLYQMYLEEHPELEAQAAAQKLTPDMLANQLGVVQ